MMEMIQRQEFKKHIKPPKERIKGLVLKHQFTKSQDYN